MNLPHRLARILASVAIAASAALLSPARLSSAQVPRLNQARQAKPRPTAPEAVQADEIVQQGEAFYATSELRPALEVFQIALQLYRDAADRAGEARTLSDIGAVYQDQSEYAKALAVQLQALPIARMAGDRMREGRLEGDIGNTYLALGQSAAETRFGQALTITQQVGDELGRERVLIGTATYSHVVQGHCADALQQYEQALILATNLDDRLGEAMALAGIGDVHQGQSQYADALRMYAQAQAIAREVGNRVWQGKTLDDIGWVYEALGQHAQALDNYQQALSIRREVGDRDGEGKTLEGIGAAYEASAKLADALDSYQQALSIRSEVGDTIGEGRAHIAIGRIYQQLRRFAEALDEYLNGYQVDALTEVRAIAARASIEHQQGNDSEADADYQRALKQARDLGDLSGQAAVLTAIGGLFESRAAALQPVGPAVNREAMWQHALDSYQQAIDAGEAVRTAGRLEEFKTSLEPGSASAYEHATVLLMRLNHPDQAFNLSERARARAFLDQLGNGRFDAQGGGDSALLEREQGLRQELTSMSSALVRAKSRSGTEGAGDQVVSLEVQLATARREYEEVLTELKLSNPEYASLVSVNPLTLQQIQDLLDDETTLLSYYFADKITLAFVVSHHSFRAVELPSSATDVGSAIGEFRAFASLSDTSEATQHHLYTLLLAPLAPDIQTHKVGIIPSGVLNYLPFAALTDGEHYFGDEHALFSLPNSSVLKYVLDKPKDSAGGVLALARSTVEGLPTLQYADQEAHTAADIYGGDALVGAAATVSAVRQRGGAASILHLAAHAELDAQNPLFSRIVLGPDALQDGNLEVHDVYGLDLRNTQLVVLSACRTQLGALSPGDEIVGLNRAFLYAGTSTVVASLWSVDDEATEVLMASFYRHLRDGLSKAEALRAAQTETRARYASAYYWAAFVLTGDAGPIRTNP